MQYQQGDVCFELVENIPQATKAKGRGTKGFVLAEGEVTGHAHRVYDNIKMYRFNDDAGVAFIDTGDGGATVTHEEHKPVNLPPGKYRVWQVVEADHLERVIRRVAD